MTLSILILSGLSGSGKSVALRALEDQGDFCVDNVPTSLVLQLAQVVEAQHQHTRLSLVIDIREQSFLQQAPELIQTLRQHHWQVTLVFLQASPKALIRRYSETRRLHPLDKGLGLTQAMLDEQTRLEPLQRLADVVIDTSTMSPHALRAHMMQHWAQNNTTLKLRISLLSFGFKYGIPTEADMVLDVRFLPNPYFEATLRQQSGKNQAVRDFVLRLPQAQKFLQHIESLMFFLLPQYQQEGKRYFTLAIGCTGGRHRSVSMAYALQDKLEHQQWHADVRHRDLKEDNP